MASFTVTDGQDPFLHISLERGESVFAESGAMVMMDGTLDLTGNVQGGLLSGLARRMVAGESMFTQKIVATRGPGDLLLSQVIPGAVHVFDVGPQEYLLNDGAFLAAETGVDLKVRTQGIGGALFGNSGGLLIMQASGRGKLCVGGFGSLFLLTVEAGQNPIIDNGHLVAWDARLSYEVVMGTSRQGGMLSNLISSQTSGEGLVTKFSGTGQVLICSRQRQGFTSWLRQQIGSGS